MADKEFVYKITGQHDGKGADEAKSKLDQLTGTLGQSAQASGLVDSKMMSLTAKLGVAAGAMYALKQAIDFASSSLNEFGAQELLDAKQAAVIKATGEAAGKTSADLKDMASALSESTSLDDAEVQKVQTLLLTFREIKGDIYDSAVKASLDLGTIFGSAESGAMQLGKALQDPILGVSMLSRAGVTFNQSQKEQIKDLAEQNKLFDAQSLILAEVKKQVGGASEAMGNTYVGNVNRLKNAWGDFKEAIGGTIASTGTLQAVMGGMTATLRGLESALNGQKVQVFSDAVANDLATSAKQAADEFERLKTASESAIKSAAEQSSARIEQLKRDIELEKQLSLAQLELRKAQTDMPESEYLRKKTIIEGVATHDEYSARRDDLQAREDAIEKELERLQSAAKTAADAAEKFETYVSQYDMSGKQLLSTEERIAQIQGISGTTPALQKELNDLRDKAKELEAELLAKAKLIEDAETAKQRASGAGAAATEYETTAQKSKQQLAKEFEALEKGRMISEALAGVSDISAASKAKKEASEQAERRRKEAEEREAKMQPGERMGRMLGNVSDTAVIGGVEYANVTGQQVQEQARSAIQKAGSDIIAGKDDFQIISQLIAKLQEMGAVFRGGYTQLANELNKLDGDIKDVKSIQKASRQ